MYIFGLQLRNSKTFIFTLTFARDRVWAWRALFEGKLRLILLFTINVDYIVCYNARDILEIPMTWYIIDIHTHTICTLPLHVQPCTIHCLTNLLLVMLRLIQIVHGIYWLIEEIVKIVNALSKLRVFFNLINEKHLRSTTQLPYFLFNCQNTISNFVLI